MLKNSVKHYRHTQLHSNFSANFVVQRTLNMKHYFVALVLIQSLNFCASAVVSSGGCKENSIRANPSDCSTYLICLHGKELRVPCPSGLKFNAKSGSCDWPENSECSSTTATVECTHVTTTSKPPASSTSDLDADAGKPTEPAVSSTSPNHPKFAPYVDITRAETNLTQIMAGTGQKDFTLAFALGSSAGCYPKWGAEFELDDPKIIAQIQAVRNAGGSVIVALGGAMGPYLEHLCPTVEALVKAYKVVLDTVGTKHLDLDVEAPIDINRVNKALAQVQEERPSTTVSYTLMVQAEDFGLNPDLGLKVLESAKQVGVRVDMVNAMTMEYGAKSADWGDAVIGAAQSVLRQMKTLWPEKRDKELRHMLGVTPMLGRNFNGKIFRPSHAQKLVNWASANDIGFLSFWSVGRDNGNCSNGPISPRCSSIEQQNYEFTTIFQKFRN